jgi:threonine/homoserine/homoserine lactone efflux protein
MRKIIKLIFSVVLSVLAAILIVSGLTSFAVSEYAVLWNIGYLVTGILFAWLGIILAKKAREEQQNPAEPPKEQQEESTPQH